MAEKERISIKHNQYSMHLTCFSHFTHEKTKTISYCTCNRP